MNFNVDILNKYAYPCVAKRFCLSVFLVTYAFIDHREDYRSCAWPLNSLMQIIP